jgi:hypothetical protein
MTTSADLALVEGALRQATCKALRNELTIEEMAFGEGSLHDLLTLRHPVVVIYITRNARVNS